MPADKKGKKPKIFVKKNNSEDFSVNDEFYEYDKLNNNKEKIVDESFFENFQSVDFDKLRQDKESNSIIEKKKIFSSSDMIEDENTDKNLINSDSKDSNDFENNLEDSIIYQNVDVEELNSKLNEDKESKKLSDDVLIYEDKNNYQDVNEINNDNEFIPVIESDKNKEDFLNYEKDSSIFDKYSISDRENLDKKADYDTLFENTDYVNYEDNFSEDDDDFGSLDDDVVYNTENYDNRNFHNLNTQESYEENYDFEDEDDYEEEYFDKKSKKKKKRGFFRVFFKFFLTFLIGCIAIGVYFALTHDLFKIDYINVVGNMANEKEVLISKSGINIGDNIFLASSKKIEKNLKTLDNIESVKVKKDYPNIVQIEVKENYVSAYINTSNGLTTIDNYGKIKEIISDGSKASGFQIKGISTNGLKVGDDFSKDISKVKFLLDILNKEYYHEILTIDFTNDKEIVLELKNSLKIVFGDLNDYSKKIQIIGILIKKIQLDGINAKEIILNVGNNPIIVKK